MNNNDDPDLIKITHYINPHMFWYKYEDSFFRNVDLSTWENGLQQYFANLSKCTTQKYYKPLVNEIVAVYNFSFNRWIRAKCDTVLQFTIARPKYVFWAIDYGIPFQSDDQWIRKLPKDLGNSPEETVFFGGVNNIIPVEKEFNFDIYKSELNPTKKWSALAVWTIQNLIYEAVQIKFIRDMQTKDGQNFGQLIFMRHNHEVIPCDEILVNLGHAIKTTTTTTADDFIRNLRLLGTNQIFRWNTNDGTPFVLKFNANKMSIAVKHAPKADDSLSETEVVQKITDWTMRNERCHKIVDDHVTDTASVCDSIASASTRVSRYMAQENLRNADRLQQKFNKNLLDFDGLSMVDRPVILKGCASRRSLLVKYKQNMPPPPSETTFEYTLNETTKISMDDTANSFSVKKLEMETFDEAGTTDSDDSAVPFALLDESTVSSIKKSPISDEDNTDSEKQALLTNNEEVIEIKDPKSHKTEVVKELSNFNTDRIIESELAPNVAEVSNVAGGVDQAASKTATNLVMNRMKNKRKILQNKLNSQRKQMPQNVIPAGFDLRNLQNTRDIMPTYSKTKNGTAEWCRLAPRKKQFDSSLRRKQDDFGYQTEKDLINSDEKW